MIHSEIINDILILTMNEAKVDMVIARKFQEELCNPAKDRDKIILNLKNLESMDSSGLGALLAFLKEVKIKPGLLALTNVTDSIIIILKLNKLEDYFKIFDDNEEAIEYLKNG